MREGWEIKKLGEVCDLYQPKTISSDMLVPNGKYLVYGANGIIGRYNEYNHEKPEVLMTCRGATCGTINVSQPYSWINGNAMVIHPKENNLIQPFLKYLLQGIDLSIVITGAAQPQITRQSLKPVKVVLPPVKEQEKIVAELDCLTGIIEKKEQQLKELDKLAQSIFYDMFGDPYEQSLYDVKPLDAYCKIFGRIGFRGYTRNDFVETAQEGAISLSPSNIINGEMDYSKCSYITWFKYEESPEIKIYNGDILVVKTGSSYGKVALVKDLPHKASINPQFVVLKEIQCNRYFLEYYLKTSFARDKYEEFVIGTAIPTFSQKKLGTLPIVDVPIDLQNAFAQKIEVIEKQKEQIKKSIQETETLFNSRLDYWFN